MCSRLRRQCVRQPKFMLEYYFRIVVAYKAEISVENFLYITHAA